MSAQFVLEFSGSSRAEASRLALSLRDAILDAEPSASVETRRSDDRSMDMGATLVLILGTPAAIAIAQGIKKWLARNNSASLTLRTSSGELMVTNLESKDVAAIAATLGAAKPG